MNEYDAIILIFINTLISVSPSGTAKIVIVPEK